MTGMRYLSVAVLAIMLATTTTALAADSNDPWEAVQDTLRDGKQHQQFWQRGWATFFGASAAYSLYLGTSASDSDDRYDGRVRAVTSSLGLGDTLVNPPPQADAYREFQNIRRRSHETDEGLNDEAITLLVDLGREEQQRAGWRGRIGSALVNLGAFLAIGVGDGRTDDGLQVAGIGMLINEIKVRTEPRTADEAPSIQVGNASVEVHPQVFATTHGLGVRVDF